MIDKAADIKNQFRKELNRLKGKWDSLDPVSVPDHLIDDVDNLMRASDSLLDHMYALCEFFHDGGQDIESEIMTMQLALDLLAGNLKTRSKAS